jgi:hypothetical protein
MKFKQLFVSTLSVGFTLCLIAIPAAQGQTTTDQATSTDAATSKQIQKTQKKADRKARRAKKDAELRQLEKNGYNPAGNQINYPQNYQNAERKVEAQKQGAKRGSAP